MMNEMNGSTRGYLILFPRSFRFAGIVSLVLAIAFIACRRLVGADSWPLSSPVTLYIMQALLVIGMWFVSSAKRKVEDERSIHFRFLAASRAFFFAVVWFLLSPLLKMISPYLYMGSGFQIVFLLLFLYWLANEALILGDYEKHDKSRKG